MTDHPGLGDIFAAMFTPREEQTMTDETSTPYIEQPDDVKTIREVAARLRRDGHTGLATAYDEQAMTAEEGREHLREFGYMLHNLRVQEEFAQTGRDVGNWLVEHGWTPPDCFTVGHMSTVTVSDA